MFLDTLAIDRALTSGSRQQVGRYRLDLGTGSWWWSDETYLMHGFEPGEVVPTTELVLAHKHPDDRGRVARVLARACATGEPFSSMHRIMDARGRARSLVVVGQGRRGPGGTEVAELVGYVVDVTDVVVQHAQLRARDDIRAAAASRGPIEQAKGIVALVRGVCPDTAFELLKRVSNERNVRLRDLAEDVVGTASAGGPDPMARVRGLLT
ncbi:PAS and ANTAR domain-containing protein [Cellulosimicrobium sp. CUA-896]|uniref:PAS and ANTAR domain-containing protein n=1 Tax=Cellulosimicrobium sp. CUA-896 TaxID=1517881 RepID=UPI001300D1AD|nr:PAS and ANTAR domain-containing protein [Cellulosimicrobium sp. CUA-896]